MEEAVGGTDLSVLRRGESRPRGSVLLGILVPSKSEEKAAGDKAAVNILIAYKGTKALICLTSLGCSEHAHSLQRY